MRLLEKKILLDSLLTSGQLTIDEETLFSGYGYQINNSSNLFTALQFLSEEAWNTSDFGPIRAIIDKHSATQVKTIAIDQSEYGALTAYINELNQKLPVFIGIIDTITNDQDSQDINIKLSASIQTPAELEKLTKQIVDLCKVAKIDGEDIQFRGFDKGSDWITIGIVGYGTYFLVMRCLKLAQEIQKTKQEYFKSKIAELDYKASLAKQDEYTVQGRTEYEERRVKIQQDEAVDELAKQVGELNGFKENEIREHAQKTTEALINIIGDGNEVHLSLNPPKEATETGDGLVNIDYSFLKKLEPKKQTQELASGENDEGVDKA